MATRRLIVFRFDRDPLVCRARVRQLHRWNPGLPVHGLYGGGSGYRSLAFRSLGRTTLRLDALHASRRSGPWNWKNGDLALLDWYRTTGHRLDFDVLHLLEWDLLLTDRLDRVFATVPPDAVGLTAYTPITEIGTDWRWVARPDAAREWEALRAHAHNRFGYPDDDPHGCLAGGACLPRAFLEDYAAADPPELGNDELRLPLFARALGHPVADTGLRRGWHSTAEDRFFNLKGRPIPASTIAIELADPTGHRAFHPVRVPMNPLGLPPAPSAT